MTANQSSDVVIRPGIVNRNPFYVSKKPAEFKQTIHYRGDEDLLHVEFPSVQPWLYVLPPQFTIGGEDDRGVRHQQIKIYVQPSHPQFPKGPNIETEVRVHCRTPSGMRVLTIPIYLHDVQPIRDFEGVFAIDFGTSSSCCAYIEHQDGTASVKTIRFQADGWPPAFDSVGSLLYFADHTNPASPDYEIGTSAMQAWRGSGGLAEEESSGDDGEAGPADDAPLSAFKYSVKRYLGTGKKTFVLNNTVNPRARPAFYDFEQLATFIIQRVLNTSEDVLGRRIKQLVATYPTTFSTVQLEALQSVFARLGFSGDALDLSYDEANAATLAYFYEALANNSILTLKAIFPSPSFLLTFDFGGGTLDIAVIRLDISEAGASHEIQTQVVGVTGRKHFGGDNISLQLYHVLKARVALYIAEAGMEPGDVEDVAAYRGALDALRAEAEAIRRTLLAGRPLDKTHADIINDVLPTRYSGSTEGGEVDERARRHFFELWDAAEGIKKKFGTPDPEGAYPEQVALSVPLTRIQEYSGVDFSQVDEVVISKAEWEPRVEPAIRAALEKAKRLVPRGEQLSLAILSGNSSRLPIVRALAQEILDLPPSAVHFDPRGCKIAVAKGAAFARRNELVPARIKYRLGSLLKRLPWDLGCVVAGSPFELFFPRGTELPTTAPYVFEPPNEAQLLHVFTRLSPEDDEPEEIGYFDFTRPAEGRAMPNEVRKALKSGEARKRPQRPGRKPPAQSTVPPITIWMDGDRSLFADKEGKSYALVRRLDTFPPEADPFSGTH